MVIQLDIDEDVLERANDLAETRQTTAGKVLSELARQALALRGQDAERNGVPVLPRRPSGTQVSPEAVAELLDE